MREGLLLVLSVVATLAIGLGLLRWADPRLLDGPADLRIVQASEEVVPFYEGVFRDQGTESFLLNDPYTGVRARPLAAVNEGGAKGPTDLLGFRNLAVPNRADVVAIGDSQTYGINVAFEQSWPRVLAENLSVPVYSMAMGGWGAVQYTDMLRKALAFEPRVAIVAFYAGNDAMESFRLAYGVAHWAHLRPDTSLTLDDRPSRSQAARHTAWRAELANGHDVLFTPWRRLYSIRPHPAIDTGWAIMAETARKMAETARGADVALIFTIIPTKELAYAARLEAEGSAVHADYAKLVEHERHRIAQLASELEQLAEYVDVLGPLSESVLSGTGTHPRSAQGHPNAAGYALIAETLGPAVETHLER